MRFQRCFRSLIEFFFASTKRLLLLTLLITIIYLLSFVFNVFKSDFDPNLTTKQPKPKPLNDSLPIILLWTPYFGGRWIHEDGFETKCLENRCKLVSNRAYLQNANVVLFHWKDVRLSDLPHVKRNDQKWVLYNMESPMNTLYLKDTLVAIQESIDWIMTYRFDSDVKSVYGYTINRSDTQHMIRRKNKEVAWMASNCNTPGKREDLVKALSAYLSIDIYGRCGHLECPKSKYWECLKMVGDNYKFYLSFENSICKDYVTEKLFRIMAFDVIPIVFGGANYSQILPSNSYIDARSFSSTKALSNYVRQISQNYTLFSSFLKWKSKYTVISSIGHDLCFLCDKIINTLSERPANKPSRDLIKWWYTDSKCTTWN